MEEAVGTSEAPFATVEQPKWLNEGTHTPLWEVIEDLSARCLDAGFREEAETLYRMAQSLKSKGTL